jgi:hypothetical protein
MQVMIGRSLRGCECNSTFLAAVTTAFALRRDVIGMTNDIAFIKLSTEGAGGIGTAQVRASFLFLYMSDDRRGGGSPAIFRGCGLAEDNQQHFSDNAPVMVI